VRCRAVVRRQGRITVLEQRSQAPGHRRIVRCGVICRKVRGQDATQIVGARGGAGLEQKPCCLQVLEQRDAAQQSVLFLTLKAKMAGDEGVVPKRGPQDFEPVELRGDGPIPDPDGFTGVPGEVSDVGWFLACRIPDAGFALAQTNPSAVPELGCEGIVKFQCRATMYT